METQDRILFIDDDRFVRTAFARSLRPHGFEVDLAENADSAEALAQQHTYAVIASDYRMPDVDGIELIGRLQRFQPQSTFMLVSGECDRDLVLEAINNHPINHVIAKPWDSGELRTVLQRGVSAFWERTTQLAVQSHAVKNSKAMDEMRAQLTDRVAGVERHVLDMLFTMLGRRDEALRAHGLRVERYCAIFADALRLDAEATTDLLAAARLHDVGALVMPEEVVRAAHTSAVNTRGMFEQHPAVGAGLIGSFETLAGVRAIIAQHHERWDGEGYPVGAADTDICLGARILALCDTLDDLLTGDGQSPAMPLNLAWRTLCDEAGKRFDPDLVRAFKAIPMQAWELTQSEH